MNIAITFDLEKDANLTTSYGITIGLKKILRLLEKYSIKSTFFVTSYIAQNFPDLVKKISQNNEIGSHGHIHKKFVKLNDLDKKGIEKSKLLLEEITGKEVIGFRAPKLYTNLKLYEILNNLNFKYDASGKPNSKLSSYKNLRIFKVSTFNVFIRIPLAAGMLKSIFFPNNCKNSISVFYFHPWEAIEMKDLYLKSNSLKDFLFRPDRWVNTGNSFIKKLENLIKYFKAVKFQFRLLKEML